MRVIHMSFEGELYCAKAVVKRNLSISEVI